MAVLAGVSAEDVLETSRHPQVVLDGDFRIVAVNAAFCRAFGIARQDATSARLYDLAAGAWNAPVFRRLLEEILPERTEVVDYEFAHDFGAGPRTFLVNARELGHDAGSRRLILMALEDVTVRRAAERVVAGANAELKRSNLDLEEFASIASHDLQEPLRKVQAFSELLARQLADRLDDGSRDSLTRIQNAAARMSTLINDLLTYARLNHGVVLARVALTDLVREVLTDLELDAHTHVDAVSVGDLPIIAADRSQMRLLFANLIGNAVKFSRVGVAPAITIMAVGGDDDMWEIVVADNGIGFEPEYAERIFGMFRRLHGRSLPGSGIGLALCRRIVEQHGGTIRAEGAPGSGARFIISLPREAKPVSVAEPRYGHQ